MPAVLDPGPRQGRFKSILHNFGVLFVGMGAAYVGTRLDLLFGIARFHSPWAIVAGGLLLAIGFLLRLWATFPFISIR